MDPEQIVKDFLSGYGLHSEKFTKNEVGHGKTPDFRVYLNDNLILYCEVKNAQEDTWINEKLKEAEPLEIVGGRRSDPTFNRLSSHIHKARKQLDAVNKDEILPNVIAFYNEDEKSDFYDLLAVTTGNFYSEDDGAYPIYKKYSEGRIKEDIDKIHLFIWIDAHSPHQVLFNLRNSKHQKVLSSIFGEIENIYS